ncbi:MAG: signal peptidase I [Defluviitaleaceae bacterium]|nr:signal peptidase I [Defluviitaleaceae bacterium]
MTSAMTKKSKFFGELGGWIKTIILSLLLAFIITRFVIVHAVIPSPSMENTIMTGDRLVANRLAYLFRSPQRFDVVIFEAPDPQDEGKLFIKRIIGLPGETIEISHGRVFADGVLLNDEFIKDRVTGQDNFGPVVVPEGSYFMLGDNRTNSGDSREWQRPFIHESEILGRASFRYFRGFSRIR